MVRNPARARPAFGSARESGGKPPHSKWSLAAILWSAGACSRFLRPNVLPQQYPGGALLAAPAAAREINARGLRRLGYQAPLNTRFAGGGFAPHWYSLKICLNPAS